jgi:hypothetical protein|tara:strand:- start:1048 stop:1641 length:594 start_codon:yes stop_codon:yes gene_type:complete
MKTFKEFSDSQIDMLARQYADLKDKTISIDQANKLRKIFDRIPDRALDALRRKKIPFISGLALSRMIKKGMPVKAGYNEEAPANAVGDGSNLAMPPDAEPGVHVKKKKKELTSLLRREDYDKVEVENLINKIESNQEIEENQIKPIVNNIKSKKEKGTYTEEFAMTAFRYVVDNQIKSTVSEDFRNKVASELLSKYV